MSLLPLAFTASHAWGRQTMAPRYGFEHCLRQQVRLVHQSRGLGVGLHESLAPWYVRGAISQRSCLLPADMARSRPWVEPSGCTMSRIAAVKQKQVPEVTVLDV